MIRRHIVSRSKVPHNVPYGSELMSRVSYRLKLRFFESKGRLLFTCFVPRTNIAAENISQARRLRCKIGQPLLSWVPMLSQFSAFPPLSESALLVKFRQFLNSQVAIEQCA